MTKRQSRWIVHDVEFKLPLLCYVDGPLPSRGWHLKNMPPPNSSVVLEIDQQYVIQNVFKDGSSTRGWLKGVTLNALLQFKVDTLYNEGNFD